MNLLQNRAFSSAIAATALMAGTLAMAPAAGAATSAPTACSTGYNYTVKKSGKTYTRSIGDRVGAYNSSSSKAKLNYKLSTTTVRTTSHSGSIGLSLEAEIKKITKIKVGGDYVYTVTKSTKKENNVSFSLPVAGKHYGYVEPRVQYQNFTFTKWLEKRNCNVVKVKSNTVRAIIAAKVFATCQSKNPSCAPKP